MRIHTDTEFEALWCWKVLKGAKNWKFISTTSFYIWNILLSFYCFGFVYSISSRYILFLFGERIFMGNWRKEEKKLLSIVKQRPWISISLPLYIKRSLFHEAMLFFGERIFEFMVGSASFGVFVYQKGAILKTTQFISSKILCVNLFIVWQFIINYRSVQCSINYA